MDPENTHQPLIAAPSQQTEINVPEQGRRPSRAYKVAGITLLACVLIVGQAMIAYFVLSQRSDIKALEEQGNNMKSELTKGRSASGPMRMHVPMNALPEMMIDTVDEEASTGTPEKIAPPQATDCQLEALGLKDVQVPGFQPSCDQRGLYRAQQCFRSHCWCVNPANGQAIPGSLTTGAARCGAAVFTGSLSKVMSLPDVEA